MQSGRAGVGRWLLVYASETAPGPDALMGWTGGSDTISQVRLWFATRTEAVAYAQAHGLAYDIETAHSRQVKPKAYADNFKVDRAENWTH